MKSYPRKQSGELFLWRYEPENKNYAGWHCSGSQCGSAWMIGFIDFVAAEHTSFTKSIALSRPTAEQYAVPNCKATPIAAEKLSLSFYPDELEHWHITFENGNVHLSLGSEGLKSLRQGMLDILNGYGDYRVGKKGSGLWFWLSTSSQTKPRTSSIRGISK